MIRITRSGAASYSYYGVIDRASKFTGKLGFELVNLLLLATGIINATN